MGMDSPPIIQSSLEDGQDRMPETTSENMAEIEEQMLANMKKPNVPNINIPERIIICFDVCCNKSSPHCSLYRLGDGTSYTPINMLKRILDFFIHTKHAINKKTLFAILLLGNTEVYWGLNFTSNLRDIFNYIEHIKPEASLADSFNFNKVFNVIKANVAVPTYREDACIMPSLSNYLFRMVVLYGRSDCVPVIVQENDFFQYTKKHLYFYTDILFTHEDACQMHKCHEVFAALQELDNGYSYVFEVGRNATKIHDCMSKLLAHPLQRPLQRDTDYSFEINH